MASIACRKAAGLGRIAGSIDRAKAIKVFVYQDRPNRIDGVEGAPGI